MSVSILTMIIAVVSKKGGVGKTTTSVHLAGALAQMGHRVLLADLDPNAGASLSLGVPKSELGPGTADVLLRGAPASKLIRPTATSGLWTLTGSVDLRSTELELSRRSGDSDRMLERGLGSVRHRFDYIFLDCPSSLGLLSRNALVAADGFLVPATPHFLASDGLEHLLETVDRLSFRVGRPTRFLGLILTMVDYRVRSTRDSVDQLRHRFGPQVFAVEIRINISLAEAPAYGQTVFQYKPYATGAKAYQLLAEELLQRANQKVSEPTSAPAAVSF